jgi:hypothetical protein
MYVLQGPEEERALHVPSFEGRAMRKADAYFFLGLVAF